jgi:hypothetical protein
VPESYGDLELQVPKGKDEPSGADVPLAFRDYTDSLGERVADGSIIADGAVTSNKAKLTAGVVTASESIALTESYKDIPGAELEINPAVASKLLVVMFASRAGGTASGLLAIKVDAEAELSSVTIPSEANISSARAYALTFSPGPHTIKLRGKRIGGESLTLSATGPHFLYELIAA